MSRNYPAADILESLDAYLRAKADRVEMVERELKAFWTSRIISDISAVLRGADMCEPTLSDTAKRLTSLFFQLRRDLAS